MIQYVINILPPPEHRPVLVICNQALEPEQSFHPQLVQDPTQRLHLHLLADLAVHLVTHRPAADLDPLLAAGSLHLVASSLHLAGSLSVHLHKHAELASMFPLSRAQQL